MCTLLYAALGNWIWTETGTLLKHSRLKCSHGVHPVVCCPKKLDGDRYTFKTLSIIR
jgi:hypothetical protein